MRTGGFKKSENFVDVIFGCPLIAAEVERSVAAYFLYCKGGQGAAREMNWLHLSSSPLEWLLFCIGPFTTFKDGRIVCQTIIAALNLLSPFRGIISSLFYSEAAAAIR